MSMVMTKNASTPQRAADMDFAVFIGTSTSRSKKS